MQTFSAVGLTKKRAKQSAAQAALYSSVQFHRPPPPVFQFQTFSDSRECRRRSDLMAVEDFTVDDVVNVDPISSRLSKSSMLDLPKKRNRKRKSECHHHHQSAFWDCQLDSAGILKGRLTPSDVSEVILDLRLDSGVLKRRLTSSEAHEVPPGGRLSSSSMRWWNPVAVLGDLRPNVQYRREPAFEDGGQDPDRPSPHCRGAGPVTITAVVDGQRFHARGPTVKQAKRRAAADVLRTLFRFRFIGQKSNQFQHYRHQ